MTSSAARAAAPAALALMLGIGGARAAEPPYPFEGTWVRANRVCDARTTRVRTYTAREVDTPGGRCTFRKVARGENQFEIFEDCRRTERPGNYTETIRMLGPDLMQVRRQAARLKIERPLRYARCTAAAPVAGAPPHAAAHRAGSAEPPRPSEAAQPPRPTEAPPPPDAKP